MKKKLFLTIQLTDIFILIVALLFESKRRYYLGIWKLEHIDEVSKKHIVIQEHQTFLKNSDRLG